MDILGIGNALIDIFCYVEDDFPSSLGFHKGTTTHVSAERMMNIIPYLNEPAVMAGGGAANVVKLASQLGLATGFIGKFGRGDTGIVLEKELSDAGVRTFLSRGRGSTGICCTFLGYDGRRTVAVSPGDAVTLSPENLPQKQIEESTILFGEFFLLHAGDILKSAAAKARAAGKTVAFDLSSAGVIQSHHAAAWTLVREYADIVFATEEEAVALTGLSPLDAAREISAHCSIFVLKRGELGAAVYAGQNEHHIPALKTDIMDETGAGDAFAAGFLYGYLHDRTLEWSCAFASLCAREVLRSVGTRLDPGKLSYLKQSIDNKKKKEKVVHG